MADARVSRLETPRLVMRRWTRRDEPAFAALNADPEVNRHLLGPIDAATSRAMMQRIEAHFTVHGFGLWALERRRDGALLGFTGLQVVPFEAPFTPAIEIGWRLVREAWGLGFAHEAAQAALTDAFARIGIDEVVAFTVPANRRSEALMQRLGMQRSAADDFDHPRLPPGHPLRPHRLYRLPRERHAAAMPSPAGCVDTTRRSPASSTDLH